MNTSIRVYLLCASAIVVMLAGVSMAADPPAVRAELQPAAARKAAPELGLTDSSGKTAMLEEYQGKVVLLDFWATWCTGCKKEIPWFTEFQRTYGGQGFAVVGVSVDEGGWKIVKPFLAEHNLQYRMLLADEPAMQRFGIGNLPDTFLIDRQGRVAASYLAGLVDRDNVEGNIRALLAGH